MAKKIRLLLTLTTFSLSLISCANNNDSEDNSATDGALSTEVPTLEKNNIMTGLQSPWDLAFTDKGDLFFTEKCRGLSVRRQDGAIRRLFGSSGSSLLANDLVCAGQSGMNGVTLDPEFETNSYVYVFMSSDLGSGPRTNRVIRLRINSELNLVSEREDIVTDIPFKDLSNSWGAAGSHSGGRIRFGPDGFLYITTGDNHNGPLPQDLSRLGGKVLRVDRNGNAAPDNSTPAGGDTRIYAYGFRNPQGLSFRPGSGRAFIAEHGPGHSDEVTALSAGGNGGWDPKPETGVICLDNYCGYTSNKLDGTPTRMTDTARFPTALPPTLQVPDSAGMGPAVFLSGAQWKAWDGALAVGIMAKQTLSFLQLSSDTSVGLITTAALPAARFRSLVQGPDGNLYIATDEGDIWKVTPK